MKTDRNRIPSVPTRAPEAPRRRFRIEKLEERIAPKKGGKGSNNCTDSCANTSLVGGSVY